MEQQHNFNCSNGSLKIGLPEEILAYQEGLGSMELFN
jgi:hypothetical protein